MVLSSALRLLVDAKKFKNKAFHLFPKLPAELRVRIWEFAFQADAELHTTRRNITISKIKGRFRVTMSQRYPNLFAVSRESRYEASRIFGGERIVLQNGPKSKKLQIYVDFGKDTVLLRGLTDLFVFGEKQVTWNGRTVTVWKYGRNLESPEPMYMVASHNDEDLPSMVVATPTSLLFRS
jgi:hypothetical protein